MWDGAKFQQYLHGGPLGVRSNDRVHTFTVTPTTVTAKAGRAVPMQWLTWYSIKALHGFIYESSCMS
jgi:hypothetical protein